MMAPAEILLEWGQPFELKHGATATLVERARMQRGTAVITRGDARVEAEGFAAQHLVAEKRKFMPGFDLVQWNDVDVLFGMNAAIVNPQGANLATIALLRNPDDDAGFYRVDWFETDGLLVCVYEGGVFALEPSGTARWHVRKYWDDLLDEVGNGRMKLTSAYDGEVVEIVIATGDVRRSPGTA